MAGIALQLALSIIDDVAVTLSVMTAKGGMSRMTGHIFVRYFLILTDKNTIFVSFLILVRRLMTLFF
jgi:hypothetical protein